MAPTITSFDTAGSALTIAINAVTNGTSGANDKWSQSLEAKANASKDEDAKAKVATLKLFDKVLKSSIKATVNDEIQLGLWVSEIRGYQDFTKRSFSELRDLSVKDQQLEEDAVKKRDNLFEVLSQVQQWLLTKDGRTNPSEFEACTTQFLSRMQAYPNELSLTQQLFKNQSLELMESELKNLSDAWGTVVSTFVEDTQDTTGEKDPLKLGDPKTIASFLCIHERLETLYGRLGTNVSLVN